MGSYSVCLGVRSKTGVVKLVGPTGVIAETVRDEGQVGRLGIADRLAVVEGFQSRQFIEMLLNNVRKSP